MRDATRSIDRSHFAMDTASIPSRTTHDGHRRRRRIALLAVAATGIALHGVAQAQLALAQQKGCAACHAVDKKVVGPAYHDVALKYKAQKNAVEYLSQRLIKGSVGVWGPVPMPPNAVSEAEARQLAQWIVSLR
jgi:cytochrome c